MPQAGKKLDLNVIACSWISLAQGGLEAQGAIGRDMGVLLAAEEINVGAVREGGEVGQGVEVIVEVLSIGIGFAWRQEGARVGEILHARAQPIGRGDSG